MHRHNGHDYPSAMECPICIRDLRIAKLETTLRMWRDVARQMDVVSSRLLLNDIEWLLEDE